MIEPEFFIRFALHIHNLLRRATNDAFCKNPLVTEIRQTCPLIYDVSVHFDDAIIQDRQTNINEGIMLVNNGLQSKYTFLTDTMGLTPEQAEAEIKRIKDEQAIGPEVIDKLDGFGA